MSNKKDKAKWQRIQENNKKTCLNCSQLLHNYDGRFLCKFAKSKKEAEYGGGVIINVEDAKRVHKCFDEYNGLNLL